MKGVFFMQKMSKTKKMILSSLMLTLSIVLSRFLSIKTPLLLISFNFVPIMLSSIWLGPKYTAIISGISDVIGAILFPFGEFFIGFTISNILMGLIYGVLLYKREGEFTRKELIIRLIISSLVVMIFINLGLNVIWLNIMYEKAFIVLITTRIIKELVMIPIQVITITILIEALKPITKKYLI